MWLPKAHAPPKPGERARDDMLSPAHRELVNLSTLACSKTEVREELLSNHSTGDDEQDDGHCKVDDNREYETSPVCNLFEPPAGVEEDAQDPRHQERQCGYRVVREQTQLQQVIPKDDRK